MRLPIKLTRLHLLVAMTMLIHVSSTGVRFTLLLQAVHLQASNLLIGLLGAVVSLFPMLLSLRVGRRIDQRGPREPMLLAGLILMACGAAGFFLHGIVLLFGIAIGMGIAQNIWNIANQQMVGVFSTPGERAAGYSLSALGYGIASLIAPILSGFSIEHLGFARTFFWQMLLPLAPLLIIGLKRLRLPAGSGAGRGTAPGSNSPAPGVGQSRHSVFDLLRLRDLREIYIVSALFEASWILFGFLTPIYGAQLGLPSSTIGLVTGSISVTSVMVRMVLPLLIRHVPIWRLLIISLAILSAGYLGFSLSGSVTMLIAFALILGIGQAIGAPMVNALLYEQSPPGRAAEAVGLRATLNNGGQTVLPLLSGALGAALGIAPAFWLLCVALLGGLFKIRNRWNPPPNARRS